MHILDRLYEIDRTLVSDENQKALSIIGKEIPLKTWSIESGTKCFDWEVPKKWKPIKGILKDEDGNVILDIKDSILHLINYSISFSGKLTFKELSKKLFYDKDNPDAIPYRTSYYAKNWGFCISYNEFKKLKNCIYEIEIVTESSNGELLIGEAKLEGLSKKEIILTSYYCHPKQINDGLSGVFLLIELYKILKKKKLNYTYRFFFWPETIGCIAALSNGIIKPKNVEFALVSTTVGLKGDIWYKKTFEGDHSIDRLIDRKMHILRKKFKPTGSDERQFSSPNIKIPTGVITTKAYEHYKEYHTSEDNLKLIDFEVIDKMISEYYNIIIEYDSYKKYKLVTKGCEPFLTKYNLYREIGTPGNSIDDEFRNWIIYLCDGKNNTKDISEKIGTSEEYVIKMIKRLLEKEIVYEDIC